jgi:quinol monooxygenase YgiN
VDEKKTEGTKQVQTAHPRNTRKVPNRVGKPVTLGSTMSQKLLIVVAEMIARSGREDELRQKLAGFVAPTRAENGCVQYDLHEAEDQPGHFLFFEKWTSAEALDAHLASPHIASVLPELGSILAQPARISKFRQIA